MLSKLIISVFTFLGMFALLFVSIPSAFFTRQTLWSYSTGSVVDQYAVSFFNSHNITVYESTMSSNTYGNLTLNDYIDLPGGDADHYIRLQWHTVTRWFPLLFGWVTFDILEIFNKYKVYSWPITTWGYEHLHFHNLQYVNRGDEIGKGYFLEDFVENYNGTYYHADNNDMSIQTNIVYTTASSSWTIEQSWDNDALSWFITYGMNETATRMNMFTLLGNLMTFNAPNLGIPGFFGQVMNGIIAIPLGLAALIAVYKVLSGIIPYLSGGSGD